MTALTILLAVLWMALGLVAHAVPTIAGTLIGAGVGATVSVAVYAATRAQARRQTTLDLFKEYYSAEFADQRRKAERFVAGGERSRPRRLRCRAAILAACLHVLS